jgi:hypothetical protein
MPKSPAALTLPPAFTSLEDAGHFDYWGAPYGSLTERQREDRVGSHRHRVLWWSSIEWDRTGAEIVATPHDVAEEGGFRPGLIPFAGNGYGDAYCWYPRWQDGPEPPVVLARHDEELSSLFARDFAECLVRCMLQDASAPDEDLAEGERVKLFRAHSDIIRPFVSHAQSQLLARLAGAFSSESCSHAEEQLAASIPHRTLTGIVLPVEYNAEYFTPAELIGAYRKSEAFYRELVESEGLGSCYPQLEKVLRTLRQLER